MNFFRHSNLLRCTCNLIWEKGKKRQARLVILLSCQTRAGLGPELLGPGPKFEAMCKALPRTQSQFLPRGILPERDLYGGQSRCCAEFCILPYYAPHSIGRFRSRCGGGVRIRGGVGIRQSGSDFNEGMHNLAGVQISAQHRRQRSTDEGAAEVTKGGDDIAQSKKEIIIIKKNICGPFTYLSDRKQTCPRYYYNY